MKIHITLLMSVLLATASLGDTGSATTGFPWFIIYGSLHPAAQPEITQGFSNLPPLPNTERVREFQGRLAAFGNALSQEANRSHDGLVERLSQTPTITADSLSALSTLTQSLAENSSLPTPANEYAGQINTRDPFFAPRARTLYSQLQSVTPSTAVEQEAQSLGISAVQVADATFAEDPAGAFSLLDVSESLLDVALGLTPVVSVGKDAYELLSGKSLVTGQNLGHMERFFAAVGLITIGTSHWAETSVRALTTFARRVGRAEVPELLEAGTKTARMLGAAVNNDLRLGRITRGAYEFVARLTHAPRAAEYTVQEFQNAARQYTEIESKLSTIVPKVVEGIETRVIPKSVRIGEEVFENTIDDVFKFHSGMIRAEGRYSMGGPFGESALYSVVGAGQEALEVAKLESRLTQDILSAERAFTASRTLDLTDASILHTLGLTDMQRIQGMNVLTPNILGTAARKAGISHILTQSIRNRAFNNLIQLEQTL